MHTFVGDAPGRTFSTEGTATLVGILMAESRFVGCVWVISDGRCGGVLAAGGAGGTGVSGTGNRGGGGTAIGVRVLGPAGVIAAGVLNGDCLFGFCSFPFASSCNLRSLASSARS